MEVAVEVEDDLFFADLSKQISLLIMDDDDDSVVRYPSVSLQAFTGANYPIAQCPFVQKQMCRRESKGTGVFIPKSSQQPRRKHRQGRYGSSLSSKSNRQLRNSAQIASQASFNNIFYTRRG
ncbi:hypothetical protein J1N35_038342 [Gossypium stocksii]|uniref:Uncharacterized protein n=1 Tax=Gossypium stocksii TaxID=47602 RepID=A0A9D3ULX5_9ROSI|nr:hypothetical protein J1N35_038342 [Gossypium stocksii]